MEDETLNSIKKASVAIGLVDKNQTTPKAIFGSGFFMNSEGLIVTAKHVLDECIRWYTIFNRNIGQVEFVAFHEDQSEKELDLHVIPFSEVFPLRLELKDQLGYAGPHELDIAIRIPNEKLKVSYLEFNNGRPKLYGEICMCGYPAGDQSLDPEKRHIGMRFSPIIQFGHISGFMPTNFTPNPYGIQTDIVGTAGSSGSPIIYLENEKVIGLAQQVLSAGVKFEITEKRYFQHCQMR